METVGEESVMEKGKRPSGQGARILVLPGTGNS
jgi:hypothetical protein